MPELPEVETTRRGLAPHIEGQRVTALIVRERRLRWPIPGELQTLVGQPVLRLERRAKYLLFHTPAGVMLAHLGMSGSLRLCAPATPLKPHDHVQIRLEHDLELRLHDPRRFGCLLWLTDTPADHALLRDLGPEPLGPDFSGDYLADRAAGRRTAIKSLIMDNHVVVGVGNIYAQEALFRAGIHPLRAAGRVSRARYQDLAEAIQTLLAWAIERGGTTLRDFVNGQGEPGYFQLELNVYGRGGEPCKHCGRPLKEQRIANRNTVWCPYCQH